ncbi:MAG: FeoA family protein [Dehalococcoidia bacterium]|nr:FeoA family protein [Dehalococcoidia bacterium]
MLRKTQMTLTQMNTKEKGTVVEINGGGGMARRLEAMGIRPGQLITKMSAMPMRGPVTIKVNGSRLAIGFGMADKIWVELDNS